MFYRIEASWDEKVTGIDDVQSGSAIYPVNIWDPIYINQWGHTLIPDYVVLPIPKIKAKANLTDLMSVFFTGSGGRLTISNRLKEILEKNSHGNIQFIPLTIYYKKKYLTNYWLTNILSFDNEKAINFIQSIISVGDSVVLGKNAIISIDSYAEYKSILLKLKWPNNLLIERVVFKKSVEHHQ
jgi:hypothetical protein